MIQPLAIMISNAGRPDTSALQRLDAGPAAIMRFGDWLGSPPLQDARADGDQCATGAVVELETEDEGPEAHGFVVDSATVDAPLQPPPGQSDQMDNDIEANFSTPPMHQDNSNVPDLTGGDNTGSFVTEAKTSRGTLGSIVSHEVDRVALSRWDAHSLRSIEDTSPSDPGHISREEGLNAGIDNDGVLHNRSADLAPVPDDMGSFNLSSLGMPMMDVSGAHPLAEDTVDVILPPPLVASAKSQEDPKGAAEFSKHGIHLARMGAETGPSVAEPSVMPQANKKQDITISFNNPENPQFVSEADLAAPQYVLAGTSGDIVSPDFGMLAAGPAMAVGGGVLVTGAAAPGAPDFPPVSRQLAEAIISIDGDSTEVRLSPQELGSVRITISRDAHGLMIALAAERPDSMELLRRHTDLLRQELANAGEDDVRFDFLPPDDERGFAHSDQAQRERAFLRRGDAADNAVRTRNSLSHPATLPGRIDMRM